MIVEDVQERVHYDRRTILLHWVVAGTIAFMWTLGRIAHLLPKGPFRLSLWSIHVLVGLALAVLVAARIGWRLTRGEKLPPAEHGLRHMAAVTVHYILYLLMIAVVLLGLAHVSAFPLFGALKLPTFWDKATNRAIGEWHGLAANAVAAVAALHAAAALYHHHVLCDRVLLRMRPGLARRPDR